MNREWFRLTMGKVMIWDQIHNRLGLKCTQIPQGYVELAP